MQLEVGRRVAAQQRQRRVAQRAVAQASLVRLVRVRVRVRVRVSVSVRARVRVRFTSKKFTCTLHCVFNEMFRYSLQLLN